MWFLMVVFLSHPSDPMPYSHPFGYPTPFASQRACDEQADKELKALAAHPLNKDGKAKIEMACVQDEKTENEVKKLILNRKVA